MKIENRSNAPRSFPTKKGVRVTVPPGGSVEVELKPSTEVLVKGMHGLYSSAWKDKEAPMPRATAGRVVRRPPIADAAEDQKGAHKDK